ncbi:hypothetical protein C8R45DRAFT_1208703 [Mycena sanguinolenta]|nr:hypothetical protein C8R45DRAFT_1208703 [Mycena sanguinolenta]
MTEAPFDSGSGPPLVGVFSDLNPSTFFAGECDGIRSSQHTLAPHLRRAVSILLATSVLENCKRRSRYCGEPRTVDHTAARNSPPPPSMRIPAVQVLANYANPRTRAATPHPPWLALRVHSPREFFAAPPTGPRCLCVLFNSLRQTDPKNYSIFTQLAKSSPAQHLRLIVLFTSSFDISNWTTRTTLRALRALAPRLWSPFDASPAFSRAAGDGPAHTPLNGTARKSPLPPQMRSFPFHVVSSYLRSKKRLSRAPTRPARRAQEFFRASLQLPYRASKSNGATIVTDFLILLSPSLLRSCPAPLARNAFPQMAGATAAPPASPPRVHRIGGGGSGCAHCPVRAPTTMALCGHAEISAM